MEIQAVSVALNGEDDARQGGRIGGNLLEHLLESCQADVQSRPRSLGWYLKMGRRSLGIVKTN